MSRTLPFVLMLCTLLGAAAIHPASPAYAVLLLENTSAAVQTPPLVQQTDTRPRVLHYKDGGLSPYHLIVNAYDQHESRIATIYHPRCAGWGPQFHLYKNNKHYLTLQFRTDRTLQWKLDDREDGSSFCQHFREDGCTVESEEETRDGTHHTRAYFRDGALMMEEERTDDGSTVYLEYWPEGDIAMLSTYDQGEYYEMHCERHSQRMLWDRKVNPDGSSEKTQYRYGGERWATGVYDKNGRVQELRLYNKQDKLVRSLKYGYNIIEVKVYNDEEQTRFSQLWQRDLTGMTSFHLAHLAVSEPTSLIAYAFRHPNQTGWVSYDRPVINFSVENLSGGHVAAQYNWNGTLNELRRWDSNHKLQAVFKPHAIMSAPHINAEYLQNMDAGDWPDMIHPSEYH